MENYRDKFTIRLSHFELRVIRDLVAKEYNNNRSNIRFDKERIRAGGLDGKLVPIADREEFLKKEAKLLKKLSRYFDMKWFVR
jgi:hypothetical protein